MRHHRIITAVFFSLLLTGTVIAAPHHPLSQIYPMDTDLNLSGQDINEIGDLRLAGGSATVDGTVNMSGNEIVEYVTDARSGAPTSPAAGQMWFDSGQNVLKYYNGTNWVITASASSVSSDLQSVLGAGNSAGSYNINMSGQDIYNVNEVFIEPSGDSIFFQPGGGASQYTLRFDDKDLRFWNNDATTVLRLNDNTGTIDIPNGNLDMNGNNIRNVGNINADGGLLAGGTGQSIGIGTNEVGRDPIGNLSDWQTSWVLADGGLGGYPRNLYFQDNQGNVVMRFDANGGINMYGNSINDVNTIKTYRVVTGKGNSNGNGVTISDDGGFYDDNDGWVTFDDRAGGNNANGLSIEQGSLRITSGNLTMNGNDIENRGNYWWGQVSLDTGTFRTSGGVTGDVGSFPASGNTNCGTGGTGSNVTCIHNYGSSKYRIEFDVPNRMDDDWWSGDGTPGGMCWGISAGDNEVNDEGWNSGVRSVITDGNGHCMGPGVDDCAAADIYDVQRTSHDVYGVVCFDPH